MNISLIITKVSEELELNRELVDKTYRYYWRGIREIIQSLPLKESLDELQFSNIDTSFNIPSLGKLAVTWEKYLGLKRRFNLTKRDDKYKEDKASV